MKFKKFGKIKVPFRRKWWNSHIMSPVAIEIKSIIRIYFGALDRKGISRITFLDINKKNYKVISVSKKIIIDLGKKNKFDSNGLFPASVTRINNKIYLFYTGFSKNKENEIISQGGLAVSSDGEKFIKKNKNILKNNNEGKIVRAGISLLKFRKRFFHFYSAGSEWKLVGGKFRPTYNIFYQSSKSVNILKEKGNLIIKYNKKKEHGLGRPQIIKYEDKFYLFYTIRTLNMKYFLGCSSSKNLKIWKKESNMFKNIKHGKINTFDSSMIYFPCPIIINKKIHIFYSANNFGKSGMGLLIQKN